ncbi:3-deoxy-D-manno-octulosonic acid transferase [Tepidimonas aquatica]|uniref:3-deoxy-D-manno-octulosonic acid transferase n=2 Tax=Tepidimonas aquatica TaxID=247482 RepID=A0A554WEQ8_9BURK|nr:3-deoxy-D-manno-octulosonic acid transferase [Tepidimonas aquatica]
MTERLCLAGYGVAMTALQPLLRVKLARRGRAEPGYLQAVPQRFGRYAEAAPAHGWLWVHAVSLGETRAAALWVQRLQALRPDIRLLWTHSTATGRAAALPLLRPQDAQAWLPWDAPGAVRRFVRHWRPRLGVLMETEVWPTLVHQCRLAGVPLWLANARLNERSWQRAMRLRCLSRPAYAALAGVLAQTPADAQRLRALGAPPPQVVGNVKFDVPWHPDPWAAAQRWRQAWRLASGRPMLLLASSREGEEAAWLAAWQRQRAARPQPPLWLVVPRHPQRFDEVHALLRAAGLRVLRRSTALPAWTATPTWPPEALQADVLLGDSLGEMPAYYALADVALLGGSFVPLGGQNLIEAAASDCPIVLGPHTFNFAQAAAAALEAGAARRAADFDDALRQALAWCRDDAALGAARAGAQRLLQQHGGAAERTVQVLLQAWDAAPAPLPGGA